MLRDAMRDCPLDDETALRLEHVIVSHQRLAEWGSPKPPMTLEALIVHFADDLDAKYHMMHAGLRDDEVETIEDYRAELTALAARKLPFICANPDLVVERGHRLIPCAGATNGGEDRRVARMDHWPGDRRRRGPRRRMTRGPPPTALARVVFEYRLKLGVRQDVAEKGAGIGRMGRGRPLAPFDQFGRRTYEMQSRDGTLSIVQGITEVTPTYTKIEGLMGAPRPVVWDMRMATSSIPRELLGKILKTAVPQDNVDARLEVVRLYLQSERYRDAEQELAEIIKDFPQHENLNEQIRQLRVRGRERRRETFLIDAQIGRRQRDVLDGGAPRTGELADAVD